MFKLQIKLFSQMGGVVLHPFHHDVEHGGGNQKTMAIQTVDLQGTLA
jgi:hypothetical protein